MCGPDRKSLQVIGELPTTVSYKDRTYTHPLYVVRRLQQDLLGLPAIRALKLLMHVDTVRQYVPDRYPELFTGLGTFPHSYEIKLAPQGKPFALFIPRNVALPHCKKVHQ